MNLEQQKKEVVTIDEASVCATIAYGYTNKLGAARAIAKVTGEKIADILPYLEKRRVMRQVRDGQDWFSWEKTCIHCGSKNRGAISYIWEG